MARRRRRIVFTLILLCLVNRAQLRQAEAQTASAPAPVQVFIGAMGKHDAPLIPDASMLAVTVDKQPAQVVSVRSAKDDQLLFAVMVDISSSGQAQQKEMKEAVVKIFQALTGEHSLGYLVLFNVQAYPSKRPLLPFEVQKILDGSRFTGGYISL